MNETLEQQRERVSRELEEVDAAIMKAARERNHAEVARLTPIYRELTGEGLAIAIELAEAATVKAAKEGNHSEVSRLASRHRDLTGEKLAITIETAVEKDER